MRSAFLILLLGFFYQVFAQKNTCEKEIEVFEATQLQFTDAGQALATYQSYLLHNQATLSPDCNRRIYSLMANFSALGSSINAADSFFKKAVYYSTLCNADTASIFALLDYARFLNNVAPDSFIVYSNIAYRQLNALAQKNNPRFAAWLAARPVLTEKISSSSDRETGTPPLTFISDMTNTVKSLWRQYFELQGSSLIYSKSAGAAEANLNMALFFDRNNPEDDNESVSLNNLGIVFQNEGRHTTAVEYFLKSIEKNKNNKQEYAVISTLGNITYSFRMIRRFDVARQYCLEAIEIARRLKLTKNLCRILSQYASVFIDEGNFAEAEKQLRESIALSHQTSNKADLCYSMRKLGNMFIVNTNHLVAGKQLIDSSAYYAAAIGDKSFLYFINNSLAAYYFKTGDYTTAMKFATSSYTESVAYQDKEIALSSLNLLHQLYEKKGDAALALQYYKLFTNLKDSSSGKEMHYALSDIQEKYESQKKQLAIDALEKEKLKRRQQFVALIIGLCVLLILVALVYFFNRKLNQQKKVLEQNNRLLSEATATQNRLFGIIGHDLKGMVAPFSRAGKIMSHYIAKNNLQDAVVFSSRLEENAGRLSETLNNLLHWSLQQMKGLQTQPQSVPVYETIQHIVSHYTDVIRLKNIRVQVDIAPAESLFTDKEAFQVIVRNLLNNAIKFTENNSIVFSSQDTGTQYQLTIADTGTGMTDQQVRQLFSMENKVTGTGTQGETGSGLGLIVVKKMAEALNASLQITSTLQSGTSITITFKNNNA
jgi:signal transduction histidine kinase